MIRVSGPAAIEAVDAVFAARDGERLADARGYTVHFGRIADDAAGGEVVDEVLATVFRAPYSYTGEDSAEISCHASPYIEGRIIELLLRGGVRMATAGEFTTRAFLAGKMDLSQAEAVADLIASADRSQHSLAMGQLRGGVSSAIGVLRDELVGLSALLELELDFGEEDVEFASREGLRALAQKIATEIDGLASSFSLGNAIREGVPVAIVGRPNVGKSTLLNALVGDDRAMVSEIAGTTRDRIEERVNIGGVTFRFIDTAGLRDTDDRLERMGIERSLAALREAAIVLEVVDASRNAAGDLGCAEQEIADLDLRPEQKVCVVVNKIDAANGGAEEEANFRRPQPSRSESARREDRFREIYVAKEACPQRSGEGEGKKVASDGVNAVLHTSAKTGAGLDELREWLVGAVDVVGLSSATISNRRHLEALTLARQAVGRVLAGLGSIDGSGRAGVSERGSVAGLSADLLAEDVRTTLHHLGTITGEITTDEILGAIFSKFCIGK